MKRDFWHRGKEAALESCDIIAGQWREGGEPGVEDLRPGCIILSKSVRGDGNIIEILVGCFFSFYIGLPHVHDLSPQNIPGDWDYDPHFADGERAVQFILKFRPQVRRESDLKPGLSLTSKTVYPP